VKTQQIIKDALN